MRWRGEFFAATFNRRGRLDPAKDQANVVRHGLSLANFNGFDGDPTVTEDDRYDYGETRWRAHGRIGGIAHCVIFTRVGDTIRLISFRRAHEKEMRRYE